MQDLTSEDETFRRLSRSPWREADHAWCSILSRGQSVAEAVAAIRELGWTKEEYLDMWKRDLDTRGGVASLLGGEDDTFRRLTQTPFDEVREAVKTNNLRDHRAMDNEDLLRHYGWTEDEYAREWKRRNELAG